MLISLIFTACNCGKKSKAELAEQKTQINILKSLNIGDKVFLRDKFSNYQEVEVIYNDPSEQFIKLRNPDNQEVDIGAYIDILRSYAIIRKR